MEKKTRSYYFFENIKLLSKRYWNTHELHLEIYNRFFKIQEESEKLEEILIYLHEDSKQNEDWFFAFLKSIRQTDFFDTCFSITNINLCTDEEKTRRKQLLEFFHDGKKELGIYELDIKDKKYKKLNAEFENKYKAEYSELYKLNSKFHNKETESINGHLDMILHCTINTDDKEILKKCLLRTFADYETFELDSQIKSITEKD